MNMLTLILSRGTPTSSEIELAKCCDMLMERVKALEQDRKPRQLDHLAHMNTIVRVAIEAKIYPKKLS